MSQKKTTTKSEKSKKNYYFTELHAEAIREYCRTDDQDVRNQLYEDIIGPVFGEMIEKIAATFNFTKLPNIQVLQEECAVYLAQIITKFKEEKDGKKQNPFGYFSVIIKRWFIQEKKKLQKNWEREIHFAEIPKDIERDKLTTENTYLKDREFKEYWNNLIDEIKEWQDLPSIRTNEKNLLIAIEIVLKKVEQIECHDKKVIFYYLREITGLNGKQISNNLKKIRARYRKYKRRWENGKV